MKVALYQNNPDFGEIKGNIDRIIEEVENKDFDVLVLPEFCATGYQFRSRNEVVMLADKAGEGYTFDALASLASDKNALIIYGFPEKRGDVLFNSAMAIFPDKKFLLYQKTHLFDSEKVFFSPGLTGFFVFAFKNARLGIMICFDWRFPEAARRLTLLGAQILCHPSNLVMPYCPDAMITRALENRVFTVTANRVGTENRTGKSLKFIGKSRIINPEGKILAEIGPDREGFSVVEINPELADNKLITPNNDLIKDRRVEFY
jgi:predicted amidohydrolase